MFHHGTIRKYTAAVLDIFKSAEVQYLVSSAIPGETELKHKNIPLMYTTAEKSRLLDDLTQEQVLSGNFNILPRGYLALTGLQKNSDRTPNRNHKIGIKRDTDTIEYMFNSVSYDLSFDVVYQCRGMNEATQIIEQLAVKFNPQIHIDIWDAENLSTPTRVPVKLEGITLDSEEYDVLSSNIVTVTFNIVVVGSLYQPIKNIHRVKEFDIMLNTLVSDTTAKRDDMMQWDVDHEGKVIP